MRVKRKTNQSFKKKNVSCKELINKKKLLKCAKILTKLKKKELLHQICEVIFDRSLISIIN